MGLKRCFNVIVICVIILGFSGSFGGDVALVLQSGLSYLIKGGELI